MKNNLMRLVAVCMSVACAVVSLNAQNDTLSAAAGDRYVVSAKPGGINLVEGSVTVNRKEGKSGVLLKGDMLAVGDKVSTGPDGKAEILLNPGSFIRLGSNSTFEFKTTNLENLQLKVESGSAIFEVFAADDFQVSVLAPNAKYLLVETGVYRLDVLSGGGARLEVWKGAARVPSSAEVVKPGRAATINGSGRAMIAKFERDDKDPFNVWSKARSKDLARVTSMLKRANLRDLLMGSYQNRGWTMYGSFGLWVYDPFFGGWCFLPFGYGWRSPYGFGYRHYLGWYDLPDYIYYPTYGGGWGSGSNGGGNNGGGSSNQPTITPIVSSGDRSPVPPFVRIQEATGMGGGIRGGDRGGSSDSGSPSYSSPSYSPPPSSSSSSSSSSGASAPTKGPDPSSPTKQP